MKQLATRQGFRVVKGGRAYHLTGKSNKGRTVRILIQLYRTAHQIQVFIGLGDSENDLSLLQNVTPAHPDGQAGWNVRCDYPAANAKR